MKNIKMQAQAQGGGNATPVDNSKKFGVPDPELMKFAAKAKAKYDAEHPIPKAPQEQTFNDKPFMQSMNETPDQIAQKTMSGAAESGNMINPEGLIQQDAAMGMNTAGMRQALSNRASKYFGADLNKLKTESKIRGYEQKSQDIHQQQGYLEGMRKLQLAKYQREKQADIANQAARAQAIGSILGVAGTVGGAMIGGPAGAAAGSQLGGMAGPMTAVGGPTQGGAYSAGLNPGEGMA